MCWKYEDEYKGECFDFLCTSWAGEIIGENMITILREKFGVKVVNETKFQKAMFDLLSKLHKTKIIIPNDVI